MTSPVTLAWAGLAALVLGVTTIVAVREPPFEQLDRPRGSADAGGDEAGEDAPRRPKKQPEAGPDDSPKPSSGKYSTAELRQMAAAFEDRVRKKDLKGGLAALELLAEADPELLREKTTREAVVDLSQTITMLPGDETERMLKVLSHKSGTAGLDILYYFVTSKGGSRIAKESERLLADEAIVERGSRAMQVAWKLCKAPCAKKKELFAEAGEHGDSRALGQLFVLNQQCSRRNRACCLHKDKELEAAITKLKERGITQ